MAHKVDTVEALVDALGGVTATHKVLHVSSAQQVFNWKMRKRIPARLFLAQAPILKELGIEAPPELWGMTESPAKDAA